MESHHLKVAELARWEFDMSDIKTDKHALAEQLGSFVESHGVEEAGKLLSVG